MKGTVKFYNAQKGFGFITGEDKTDYFVHQTSIKMEGFRMLRQNQTVTFTPTTEEKGPAAIDVNPV